MIRLFLLSLFLGPFLFSNDITIYINHHYEDKSLTQSRWGATVQYLREKLPQHHFTFLPINPKNITKIQKEVANKNIDFLMTQPIIYSHLHHTHGVQRLLTLENRHGMTKFGSVIITHKDSPIKTIEDIKGKNIAAVAPLGFGGWLIAYSELFDKGIDPIEDKTVVFLGDQKKIALAVSDQKYDIGIIRTGMLELLSSKGILDTSKLRVINELQTPFPIKISTKLYPEWVFAVASHVDNTIAKDVFKAIVNIKRSDQAAIKGNYSNWVIPEDYTDVDDLLKKFHLAQYHDLPQYEVAEFITAMLIILVIIILIFFYLRYRILFQAEREQKIKIAEITHEIKEKDKLLHIQSRHAAMGEMVSMIAHQWRQPLNTLALIQQKISIFIDRDIIDTQKMKSSIDKSMTIINNMSETINDFRDYFKPNKETKTFLVSDLIEKALDVIGESIHNSNISINKELDKALEIQSYENDLLQVLLNLIQNAKDALIDREVDSPHITLESFQKNNHAYINVSDNGGGIEESITSKIFEPYFSTKNKNGTGLGLYMSKSIVEGKLQGQLKFTNHKNSICFSIILPLNYDTKEATANKGEVNN